MKNYTILWVLGLFINNIYAATDAVLSEDGQLRVLNEEQVLVAIDEDRIPKGTEVRYVNEHSAMSYSDSDGKTKVTSKGWVSGIIIDSFPSGSGLREADRKRLNAIKGLYLYQGVLGKDSVDNNDIDYLERITIRSSVNVNDYMDSGYQYWYNDRARIDQGYGYKWKRSYTRAIINEISDKSPLITHKFNFREAEDRGHTMAEICPAFPNLNKLERKMVWAIYLASITKYESTFDPRTYLDESSHIEDSYGLVQLSPSHRNKFNCTSIRKGSVINDLYDGERNLRCAVQLLESRLFKGSRNTGGRVFIGGKYSDKTYIKAAGMKMYQGIYWSVTNSKKPSGRENKAYYEVKGNFKAYSNSLCH